MSQQFYLVVRCFLFVLISYCDYHQCRCCNINTRDHDGQQTTGLPIFPFVPPAKPTLKQSLSFLSYFLSRPISTLARLDLPTPAEPMIMMRGHGNLRNRCRDVETLKWVLIRHKVLFQERKWYFESSCQFYLCPLVTSSSQPPSPAAQVAKRSKTTKIGWIIIWRKRWTRWTTCRKTIIATT